MSIFPTKILLATDGSEEARQAAQAAAELSKDTDSEVHVAYVLPSPTELRGHHLLSKLRVRPIRSLRSKPGRSGRLGGRWPRRTSGRESQIRRS